MKSLVRILIPLLCAAPSAAFAATFDFEAFDLLTATSFSDTQDGITAIFDSPQLPGAFIVGPVVLLPDGNALSSPSASTVEDPGIPLEISFSAAIGSIAFDFTTSEPGTFTLTAFMDDFEAGNAIGNSTEPECCIGLGFGSGQLGFTGAGFNRVVLSTSANFFGIDNVVVTPVPVPPAAALFPAALLTLVMRRRHRGG